MNLRRWCWTASTAAAMAALGMFGVAVAQDQGGGANTPALPAWAYPVNPGRGGAGAGRGNRGPNGPGAAGGANGAAPNGGAPGAAAPAGPGGAGRGPGRAPLDNVTEEHVPSSTQGYTAAYIADLFSVPDWFPDTHPTMPDVVAHGDRTNNVMACGYCHLPNGQGRPENESIAGLPDGYILQQLSDFKNDLRKSSEPRMGSVSLMVRIAKGISEDQAKSAATYFSSIKLQPWIRVVEADTVPVTRPNGGMLNVVENGGTEPILDRVIEVPESLEQTELRNSKSGFVAYVPKGSLARGKELVMNGGNGKTIRCTICHGADLKGLGNVPSIAGRSPSQMTRQIMDIQNGARNGPYTQLMKEPVRQLGNKDIVDIVAYLASLQP